MSTTRVLRPRANAAEASPSVTVVLPTPPLRELILITRIGLSLALARLEVEDARRGSVVDFGRDIVDG
jgi:hypothetical protein